MDGKIKKMPEKKDPFKSPTEKAIRLFSRLFFTRKIYSLTELAQWLNASKQTVMRLLDDIERSYGVKLETFVKNRQRYYRIHSTYPSKPHLPISSEELRLLELCRTFTGHLLGEQLVREVEKTIEKTASLLPEDEKFPEAVFETFLFGTIDYTPFSDFLKVIASAIENKKICNITYKSLGMLKETTLIFQPLRIFSRRETIYIYGIKWDGKSITQRILTLHRIKNLIIENKSLEHIKEYTIESDFNKQFGVIKGKPFKVIAEFMGKPAHYIAERRWSPDQQIEWLDDHRLRITFTATSRPEIISWILSFGDLGYLIEPKDITNELSDILKRTMANYKKLDIIDR